MSTYRLYKSPQGDIVRVKMGFSWQAFFVGSLKAIVRRTWLLAAIGLLVYLLTAFYNGAPTATSRTAALLLVLLGFYGVYMLFCGVNGNRWLERFAAPARLHVGRRRAALKKRGPHACGFAAALRSTEPSVQEPAARAALLLVGAAR